VPCNALLECVGACRWARAGPGDSQAPTRVRHLHACATCVSKTYAHALIYLRTRAQAMAIPFYIGANVAVDMAMGSAVKAAWFLLSPVGAYEMCIAAASGLIVGDGLWSIFDANLALFKVAAPFCISFTRGAKAHA